MEHANSTAISLRSEEELPNIAAHEFFHLWNVKRIRPVTLDPVDYTKEQYTRALWRSEEHTSELQSSDHLVCRLLLEKKKKNGTSKSAINPSPSRTTEKKVTTSPKTTR